MRRAVAFLGAVVVIAGLAPVGAASRELSSEHTGLPDLRVNVVADGLDHPWAVRSVGDGRLLVTQRDRAAITRVNRKGGTRDLRLRGAKGIWVSGETGLMGLEVDPRFEKNRRVYTCTGWTTRGGHDVRVLAWKVNRKLTRARRVDVLLAGLPATSGRHGGCQLLITESGALLVGTGDAAVGTNPRNLDSLGGKTLRLNRFNGRPWPKNPWAGARSPRRYVLTYGHRNVQGLAQRRDGSLWSVEHGTYRDDEVNRLKRGGDYGYHPVPGYNETVPMTDHSLPGTQQSARWSSGTPTIATSGAAFVPRAGWGQYAGTLAVAALAGEQLKFLRFNKAGQLIAETTPPELRRYGRLRGVAVDLGGSLLVTTDNGNGTDRILSVWPKWPND